ncbi:MAG: dihydropteroate synthase [Sphingobacteriales bacterium]|nr:dihydropteroate synthase [Sphingobacteriales bacterium]
MGIINITPDSFYSDSRKQTVTEVLEQANVMISEGADILDLGAYSTRPQAEDISEEEEWQRISSILPTLRSTFPKVVLSLDTFRSGIAKKAIDQGIDIINDISGGELDPNMFNVIASNQCPYIMMHMRGTPQTMQSMNTYDDLVNDVILHLSGKIKQLNDLNFHNIILDPGFGFAKNINQNFELLSRLEELHQLPYPLLVGLSRKSMIYKTLGITAEESLNGTTALHAIALEKGAQLLRVHDVKEAKECIALWKKTK